MLRKRKNNGFKPSFSSEKYFILYLHFVTSLSSLLTYRIDSLSLMKLYPKSSNGFRDFSFVFSVSFASPTEQSGSVTAFSLPVGLTPARIQMSTEMLGRSLANHTAAAIKNSQTERRK
ncbi:hypothetical protein AVEN_104878-1 [Araneus ventricosus]|uniref:Uncharacterized protein n=1 Tax=Araneus ventricosus TaxID=182803 RepID=A0A4Y2FGZ6_ARAVE|nr:hypothetical protein AVEN_104878-1 [Araneus ventricosus]